MVWFNVMFHLIRRGRENLRLLTKEWFTLQVDTALKSLFIKLLMNWTNTTWQTINQIILQGKDVCTKEADSPYCQVKTIKLYLSKLNPAPPCLWQRSRATENFGNSDEVWYCNVPMGKIRYEILWVQFYVELGLSQKYNNHSIRATLCCSWMSTI